MLQLSNITLYRGEKILFDHADLTLYENHKIGIVGNNGCGKSTLFSLLLGNMSVDTGAVNLPNHLKWGVIEQQTPHSDLSLIDFVLEGDQALQSLQHQLKIAETNNNGIKIAELHGRLAEIDGYSAPARAASLLIDLGFSQHQIKQSVNQLSGGWRMRLNLCKVLLSRADILLLDEPTNHLDLEGILGLEKWLQIFSGTLLVISHDREFLDRVTQQTVYITDHQFKCYKGNYSFFEKQYANELAAQQTTFIKQQKKIAHMQSYVDRFRYKASKAKQAQSRLKAIEKMETIAAVQINSPFYFKFLPAPTGGNPMLYGRQINIGYNDKKVIQNATFHLNEGDRIALIGPNGAGKSTFIKLLAEKLQPLSGDFVRSNKLKIGYFAQHQIEQLNLDSTPLAHLIEIDPTISEQQARHFLGGFYFQGNRIIEPMTHFSGGEKARLALALLIWTKPNLLLLDEPTNHLDMQMREALSLAMQDFTGAVILVSHDRYLLESTADQLWLVANHKIQSFDGNLNDYAIWFEQYQKQTITNNIFDPMHNLESHPIKPTPSQNRAQQEAHDRRLRKLESKLQDLQEQLIDVQKQLANPVLFTQTVEAKQQQSALTEKQTQLQQKIDQVEAEWFGMSE
ncbi:MAG: hypothetical protein A3F17_02915 [Gammaproteobacteria bacterium RIFCSPHIGHO2_12_FULL_41_15]|nr:MAG: hypothetical protein A3F17_02915 [Gammaproteobacteria bacterium RIFCSPHIGHO2_12_FULL_41_15]